MKTATLKDKFESMKCEIIAALTANESSEITAELDGCDYQSGISIIRQWASEISIVLVSDPEANA